MFSKSHITITRFNSKIMFFYPLISLIHRLSNRHFVVDLPTPIKNLLLEIRVHSEKFNFLRTLNTLYIIVLAPFVFIGVSLVLEYSDESNIFKIFSKIDC